ncbi:MAG: hypothetical protein Q7S22_06490 [Candidatus Micrarchaeota archaeon]|nr:hypothetical protein [Candidatus Micrarchaeota archaeon]
MAPRLLHLPLSSQTSPSLKPPVKLTKSLLGKLRYRGIRETEGTRKLVADAGYRDSPKIAALLLVHKFESALLHHTILSALNQLDKTDSVNSLLDTNRNVEEIVKQIEKESRKYLIYMVGSALGGIGGAAGTLLLPVSDNIKFTSLFLVSVTSGIVLLTNMGKYFLSTVYGDASRVSKVLVDHLYEFLSVPGNQERLTDKIGINKTRLKEVEKGKKGE